MSAQTQQRRPVPASVRKAINAMYAGAVLTLIAAAFPVIDQATSDSLADRLRSAYPHDPSRLDAAESGILTYLFTLAVAGLVLWTWLAWAGRRGKRWARAASTAVFVLATFLSVYNFTQPHPTPMTVAGLLPCAAGLVAVALLWKGDSAGHFGNGRAAG
ncbi:hypothetical protein [Streptomyces sp. I05A-00742]|uniref:hypothetical protein n=1 Tax=Streptomyces sp. I05A-00742 TaxID=2732853 RepID=UPI00148839D5|nr:hypothetical protein [Streptomyces sp. I05A-00742]